MAFSEVLQIQKEGAELAVVVRGNWSRSRPRLEDFLATLGESGIKTACDLEPGKQFKDFSVGAASARIELDPDLLRQDNYSRIRVLLNAVDDDLRCEREARAFSRSNIIDQVDRLLGLNDADYAAVFGVTRAQAAEQLATLDPAAITILSNDDNANPYEVPQSGFKLAKRVDRSAAPIQPLTATQRKDARQNYLDEQVQVLLADDGTADLAIDFSPAGNDAPSQINALSMAESFRQAAKQNGLKIINQLRTNHYLTKARGRMQGVVLTITSAREAFKAVQLVKAQQLGVSEKRLEDISGAVKKSGPGDWLKSILSW